MNALVFIVRILMDCDRIIRFRTTGSIGMIGIIRIIRGFRSIRNMRFFLTLEI